MLYSSRHVAALFNVSRETIRTWATEFARHLSISATPTAGKHRNFDENDLAVFSLIAEMKNHKAVFEEIHLALDNGQLGIAPITDAREMVASDNRQQLAALERQIVHLNADREKLLDRLKPVEDDNIRLRALLERSDAQLAEAKDEIRELNREIGRLQAGRGE